MKEFTGLIGTFISWHASFEIGRNEEMISLMPEYKDYLTYINTHMYDLEVVFKKNYVDYRCKGSSSLKKVLPVICSGFSYDDENIQDGTTAMETWGELVTEVKDDSVKDPIREDLLSYCELDTLALVEIYKKLTN